MLAPQPRLPLSLWHVVCTSGLCLPLQLQLLTAPYPPPFHTHSYNFMFCESGQ